MDFLKQLLDLASVSTALVGYCSFFVPLAEAMAKPALFVWSRRGLKSGVPFVRQITPQKVLHKRTSIAVMDDASEKERDAAVEVFLR